MSDLPEPIDGSELNFDPPDSGRLDESTVKGIVNAWKNAVTVLPDGRIMVDVEYLHTICRTDKPTANQYVVEAPDNVKRRVRGKKHIEGSHIISLLDERIQDPSTIRNEKYTKISERIYRKVRDTDAARMLRVEYRENLEISMSKMLDNRISELQISQDELTGNDLVKAEFSHIRSKEAYPYLADKIWNGLAVNKETHEIITERGCTNEDQLKKLCMKMGWRCEWYDEYKHIVEVENYRLQPCV